MIYVASEENDNKDKVNSAGIGGGGGDKINKPEMPIHLRK